KVQKVLSSSFDKTLALQLSLIETGLGHIAPLTAAKQPTEFVAAQKAALTGLQQDVARTLKEIFEIQTSTLKEVKGLVEEGVLKFSPEAISKLVKAA
ncbi:MAG TPA: hypothetical protein DCY89_08280, partial [Gammaproteobacteria bacterium]|nr:hypothetical protein [Gammaproteobacteria bacterium]